MAQLFPQDPYLSLGAALSGRVPLATDKTILPQAIIPYFQAWKQQYAPNDSGEDYDLQGAFLHGAKPDPQTGHWPDTWKRPNHPTFSNQSIYANLGGARPGHWEGDTFVPPPDEYKVGAILPIQKNLRTGERSFAIPQALRPLLGLANSAQKAAYQGVDPLYDPEMLQQSMSAGFDLGMPTLGAVAPAALASKQAFNPEVLSMLAGQHSLTGSGQMLGDALNMLKSSTKPGLFGLGKSKATGITLDDIDKMYAKTGWFPLPGGGHMAHEISDAGMGFTKYVPNQDQMFIEAFNKRKAANPNYSVDTLINQAKNDVPTFKFGVYDNNPDTVLSDIIDHPELYEAYPQLKNVPTGGMLGPSVQRSGIHRSPYGTDPGFIRFQGSTLGEGLGVAGHEIQHRIQHIENWPSGGNPDNVLDTLRSLAPYAKELYDPNRAPHSDNVYEALMGEVAARFAQNKILAQYGTGKHNFNTPYSRVPGDITFDVPQSLQVNPAQLERVGNYATTVGEAQRRALVDQLMAIGQYSRTMWPDIKSDI